MSTLSIEKSQNAKSAASKKGSAKSNAPLRRKVRSATVIAKKPLRSLKSKAKRGADERGSGPQSRRYTPSSFSSVRLASPHAQTLDQANPLLEVAREAAIAADPSERPFDDPSLWRDDQATDAEHLTISIFEYPVATIGSQFTSTAFTDVLKRHGRWMVAAAGWITSSSNVCCVR
jgi:hypothetical protein